MTGRAAPEVLVAGVGNLFYRDDGFGPAVARALTTRPLPPQVEAIDYGNRGLHLAFDLLRERHLLLLIDVRAAGNPPGTLSLLEPRDPRDLPRGHPDGHGIDLPGALATAVAMGARIPRTLLLCCEPADLGEGIGLSPAVERAVEPAANWALELVAGIESPATKREMAR